MRRLISVLGLVMVIGVPAATAALSPRALVLYQSDVPAGFRLDRSESGARSNELEGKSDPRLRALFARWGRLTGYEAVFERGDEVAVIDSRADVFRRAEGARGLHVWLDRELMKTSPISLTRAPVAIGAGGWVYSGLGVTIVTWRFDRVFGGVSGEAVAKARTLALARKQQRRIAAALR